MKKSVSPQRQQRGASTTVLIVIIGIASIFIMTLFKLYPMYYGNLKLQSALEAVQQDSRVDSKSKREIWNSLQKRLYIDNVEWVKRENVTMARKNGKTTVTVTYEARDSFIGNLFIGANFSESVVIDR